MRTSKRQISRRMKDTYVARCSLFVQENWPRATTLAPFLGDRFVGTTTPRKAKINVPHNCHGNVVRATGSFTLSDSPTGFPVDSWSRIFIVPIVLISIATMNEKLRNVGTWCVRFFYSTNIKYWTITGLKVDSHIEKHC